MTHHQIRPEKQPIQLVIFDWAGTMIDHGSVAPAGGFVAGFQQRGVEISMAEARTPMGMGKRDHIAAICAMPRVAAEWERVHGKLPTDSDIDAMYHDFANVLLGILPDYTQLIDGVAEAVETLRSLGLKIGGTTGYFEEAMIICQEAAAKQGYAPDSSICATQVSAGRPAPWMIYQTMERLGVYPARAVLKVGDTVPDIAAGQNAGTVTVGVAQTGNAIGLTKQEWLSLSPAEQVEKTTAANQMLTDAGADFVVNSVTEIPNLVKRLNRF